MFDFHIIYYNFHRAQSSVREPVPSFTGSQLSAQASSKKGWHKAPVSLFYEFLLPTPAPNPSKKARLPDSQHWHKE